MPPRTWLRHVLGFSTRPLSKAPTQRVTRTRPNGSSTFTSQNCAPNDWNANFFCCSSLSFVADSPTTDVLAGASQHFE